MPLASEIRSFSPSELERAVELLGLTPGERASVLEMLEGQGGSSKVVREISSGPTARPKLWGA